MDFIHGLYWVRLLNWQVQIKILLNFKKFQIARTVTGCLRRLNIPLPAKRRCWNLFFKTAVTTSWWRLFTKCLHSQQLLLFPKKPVIHFSMAVKAIKIFALSSAAKKFSFHCHLSSTATLHAQGLIWQANCSKCHTLESSSGAHPNF